MDKPFTPREVDALIPRLESIFQHVDVCQTRARALTSEMPSASAQTSPTEVADMARIRSQIEFLLQAVQDNMNAIALMGGIVKDLGLGLVDFPGRIEGEDVWLCWKRGEKKLDYWHPLFAGFSERQAIRRNEGRRTTTH